MKRVAEKRENASIAKLSDVPQGRETKNWRVGGGKVDSGERGKTSTHLGFH